MEKHFCNCTDTNCRNHPVNHSKGCDPCIIKNLNKGEIPSCFFLAVSNNTKGLDKYTFESFADFFNQHKAEYNMNKLNK